MGLWELELRLQQSLQILSRKMVELILNVWTVSIEYGFPRPLYHTPKHCSLPQGLVSGVQLLGMDNDWFMYSKGLV